MSEKDMVVWWKKGKQERLKNDEAVSKTRKTRNHWPMTTSTPAFYFAWSLSTSCLPADTKPDVRCGCWNKAAVKKKGLFGW